MPRRPPLIVATALLFTATACADTLALDPPEPSGAAVRVCSDLLADLPGTVAGQEAREVAPAGAGAAWGNPAVTVRCGVDRPAGLEPTSRCDDVDGVGWYTQEDDEFVFTTIGRTAYVEVTVPQSYDPPADALVDLAGTIRRHDPVLRDCV